MRYQLGEGFAMSDILVRGLDDGTVSRLDELAAKKGVSRNTVIRTILAEATRVPEEIERGETLEVLGLMSDLADPDVMAGAWR